MDEPRVLIVDDEQAALVNCDRFLSRKGYVCSTLDDPTSFREVLGEVQPAVLLLDLRMPEVDGMTILTAALADDPALPVIIMTAHGTVASAVHAIEEGAFDYLEKPFTADQLILSVDRAARHRQLSLENRALREMVERGRSAEQIIGSSGVMKRVLDRLGKVAPTDSSVLILGESGTGKELIARSLHANSARREGPFVPVDCAALPQGLLESELFGYEPGAFTGALKSKKGLMEEASGGTVFLDEFTELSLGLQAKLLRALEERQVRRLGGAGLIDVDIRVVAATNADLDAAVAAGTFREDLYYRLNVVPIVLPPLRERAGDVVLLARKFFARFSALQGSDPPRVSTEVWDALERYPWPGNVREVRNLTERLVVLHEGDRVTLADLPEVFRVPSEPPPGDQGANRLSLPWKEARLESLRMFRMRYAKALLRRSGGNVIEAARVAGVTRRTVHRWLDELRMAEREES